MSEAEIMCNPFQFSDKPLALVSLLSIHVQKPFSGVSNELEISLTL